VNVIGRNYDTTIIEFFLENARKFARKMGIWQDMYMNHVPTYEHLKRRVERLQKKDAVATVTEKERQQVLNVLNPRSYETPDELLHVLSGILREFQP
jgi:hypothetical protein